MLARTLLLIAIFGTVTSTVYLLLVLAGVIRFARRRRELLNAPPYTPPVSVLKTVHGTEPNLRENIESFFRQDYPNFELIFCARREDDAALQIARQLSEKYPAVKTRIITSGEPPWTNAKLYS